MTVSDAIVWDTFIFATKFKPLVAPAMTKKPNVLKDSVTARFIGEFTGAFLFSLLFFVFVYRYTSPDYEMGYAELSFYVGLALLASGFTPSFKYIVDVIPVITLIKLLEEGFTWKRFLHIPLQFAGSALSVWVFFYLNSKLLSNLTMNINFETLRYPVGDIWISALVNGLAAGVLYYLFYIVRYVFQEREFSGILLNSTVWCLLFFSTAWLQNISSLNPFGLLWYSVFSGTGFTVSFDMVLIHVLSPLFFLTVSKFYIDVNLVKGYIGTRTRFAKESAFKNYDV